jgi:lipopolysaccharide export system protein LptC
MHWRHQRFGAAVNSVEVPTYQAGMDARFAIAARHSRMVRILRVAVPAAVLLAMAAIVLVSVFNPFRMLLPKLPIDMGNLVVSGTKITMESPHMAGFSADRRPYEVWAKTATQDVTDPDHVELKAIRAKMLNADQSTVTMVAHDGMMNTKDQLLDLHHDIYLQTTTGNEAWLSQAAIDMNKGNVASDEHVDVRFSGGTVSSDRLRIFNGGELVTFEGNVVMHLDNLNTAPADPSATASAAPAAEAAPATASNHPTKTRHSPGKSAHSK